MSKREGIDNRWEILTNSKFALQKKKKGGKNLLSTIPGKNKEKKEKKGKESVEKSQLRKEYEANTTSTQKSKKEEVIEIIDKFHKGGLDVNVQEFMPR
jgi:hypothetical protein